MTINVIRMQRVRISFCLRIAALVRAAHPRQLPKRHSLEHDQRGDQPEREAEQDQIMLSPGAKPKLSEVDTAGE
jgi:hypothetical protein